MIDSLALDYAQRLMACESISPACGSVFDAMESILLPLGFTVERFVAGADDPDPAHGAPVENLFAIRGKSGRHFAFAGDQALGVSESQTLCHSLCHPRLDRGSMV